MDEKLRKLVSRHCPATEKAFFGRKYLVPTYRQTDYENLDFTNALELDRLVRYALGESDVGNQRNLLGLASTLGTLAYDRQTLFLEADLGSALNRTQVPDDLQISELRLRWPSFRIVLPRDLLSIEEGKWLTHFVISRIDPEMTIHCPTVIAQEIDAFTSDLWNKATARKLERLECRFADTGLLVSCALNHQVDDHLPQITYTRVITQAANPVNADDDDNERTLLSRLERLALNVLIFLSAAPLEYEPASIIRKGRREGEHQVPELRRAQFVGRSPS
jgi:hypothetical protein